MNARHKMMLDKLRDILQDSGEEEDEWAMEFVASCRLRLASGYPLTERQAFKLDEIWERY